MEVFSDVFPVDEISRNNIIRVETEILYLGIADGESLRMQPMFALGRRTFVNSATQLISKRACLTIPLNLSILRL